MLHNNIDKSYIIFEIIYFAIDDLNELLPKGDRLSKDPKTIIMGKSSTLDSLNLVNLVVGIDAIIQEKTGQDISLFEKLMIGQKEDVVNDVESLSEFIMSSLNEK